MPRAPKRARMSIGGCNPPRYEYEPMEQDEEQSVYQDKQVVYPVVPPSPMPSPTPEPEEEEEIEPMEEIPQEIIDVSSDEEQDVDQGDGQPRHRHKMDHREVCHPHQWDGLKEYSRIQNATSTCTNVL